jgi:ABC-type protease/lipase transport system fused ATPase/permease subunit
MIDGRLQAFGPKDEVMKRMTRQGQPRAAASAPVACQTA